MPKISQLTEATEVTDNDLVAVVDIETTTTKKGKISTFFNWILSRANRWTKAQTIISDGTNPPLVVRNSTDTSDLFNILPSGGAEINGDYKYLTFKYAGAVNGGGISWSSSTLGDYRYIMTSDGTRISFIKELNAANSLVEIGANYIKAGSANYVTLYGNYAGAQEIPSGSFMSSGLNNLSIFANQINGGTNKVVMLAKTTFGWRSVLEWANNTTVDNTIAKFHRSGKGQVIIGGTTPDANAILQIDSTTKGALLPRMTTVQSNAISTPATGLEHFDTTADTKRYKKTNGWSYAGLITETQFDRFYIGTDITVANGNEFNLFSYISEADKNAGITDAFNPLVIASNNIKTVWTGSKQIHTIRVEFAIPTGNAQFYRVELRRYSDNSIVASKVASRNQDEPSQTIDFVTRTLSATDPYVTGGFYIAFVNNSGVSCTVEDAFQLVIINQYQ